MPIFKEIKENLKAISNIETITRAYQEIATLRMYEIRQTVLSNRDFIEELSRVYTLSKKAYLALLKKGGGAMKVKENKFSFPPFAAARVKEGSVIKRGRGKVAVFLSCNRPFYGTLILDLWQEIQMDLKEKGGDLVVVGRTGKYFAETSKWGLKMFYFELDDEKPERERVKEIMEFLKNYEEIIIFHGRYHTVLSQKVVQTNISGITLEKELGEVKSYLFEPPLEAVLDFFETELLSAFFNQTLLEHRLSRYATRMVAMYQATENAEKIRKKLEMKQKKLERQSLNKKQIEVFSGFQLWS